MLYTLRKGCWCDVITLNVHAQTDNKSDHLKYSFCEELECVFNQFLMYHMKIVMTFQCKSREEGILKQQKGMSLH